MRHLAALLLLIALAACPAEKAAPWLTYPRCTSCHGDATRGPTDVAVAPPFDVAGNSTTTARAVGAHQKHLLDGPLRGAVPCGECHVVPTDPYHSDGVVQVVFGPIASTLFDPAWNGTALTCSTYCHGGTVGGGTNKTPIWTKVDGTQAACGTCHGIPPPAPHIQNNACGGCHAGYTATTVDPTTHIDGVIQASSGSGGCTSCHGDSTAPAAYQASPPRDTHGNVATTAPGVGAHRQHVADGPLRPAMACTECHPPTNPATHPEGTLSVTFGPLARAGGSAPVFNPASVTCSSVYCHGATLGGGAGTVAAPVWTKVDGTQVTCGACHKLPPPAPHPQQSSCGDCHPGYTSTTVVLATHIDGIIDLDPSGVCSTCTCTSCHGDSSRLGLASSSAPPFDTSGNSATTAIGVGAHRKHLEAGPLSGGIACTECHPVPATTAASGPHRNGVVDVVFGPLSNTGTVASWNAASRTCAGYCHGATLVGGTARAPVWTTVNGSQNTCTSCHGNPPSTGHHTLSDHRSAGCGACHAGYSATAANVAVHVNGLKEVGNKLTTYSPTTRTCTNTCHGNKGTW